MTTQTVYLALVDGLSDWEYGHAAAQINIQTFQQQPGRYEIKTVAASLEPVRTIGGVRMLPDVVIEDVDVDGAAMLMLIGSDSWEAGENAALGRLARRFREAGKPVAAICGATIGLAREGLLDDVKHTSNFPGELGTYGGSALYQDARVVRDQGVITAGGASSMEWTREILLELEAYRPQTVDAWYELYREDSMAAFERLMASVQD
ncbi:type 1 glutamine amidotransferase family protein [Lentzea roselyniae]|uniref:Type 1 glutamine amidotransferase family protein n=1 Tax=Lentzea roselyniae TaxID=531940 RepID=A0ABP7B9U8_9PSEU